MLETHIVMSSLIFRLVLILMFRLAFNLVFLLTLSLMLCLTLLLVLRLNPRENCFEPRRFDYDPRPHHGDCFPHRPGLPTGGSFPDFESRHLDGTRFPHRGSRPTQPSGEVQRMVKTSSGRMVKCWIPKIYLTNPSTEPSTCSRSM
jgi:hypothetical protein